MHWHILRGGVFEDVPRLSIFPASDSCALPRCCVILAFGFQISESACLRGKGHTPDEILGSLRTKDFRISDHPRGLVPPPELVR